MEMEGRGYSDMYRNTSEELFIKTMMEGSMGMPAPTMEMLGFKNLSQSYRGDSEELFKNWLNPPESGIAQRTRQASRRIPAEPSNLSNQQPTGLLQKRKSTEILHQQNASTRGESSSGPSQHLANNVADKGQQGSNLFLAKAWLNSSQPMTRSRSSELRRKYAALQSTHHSIAAEAMHDMTRRDINFNQEHTHVNGLNNTQMHEVVPNHMTPFMSPSNSSSSTFNTPQVGSADNISSIVSMLKGTLERKKLNTDEKEAGYFESGEVIGSSGMNTGQGNHNHHMQASFQSHVQVAEPEVLQMMEGSHGFNLEGVMAATNQMQMSTLSQEPSQSESSAAAPVISAGFDGCDGSSISGPPSVSETSMKKIGNGRNSGNAPKTKVEQGDPTKKRRVERYRKMTEAKEKNSTPPIPSDTQSLLKRCENLEKEVRSLKLNLAFMNRKDSEQTKQMEDLQKQNEDLTKEKQRLLEEIERMVFETGRR